MLFRFRFVLSIRIGAALPHSFCSFSDAFPSFGDRILIRRDNFNRNRPRLLKRNEKSLLAENRQGIPTATDCATLVLFCRLGTPSAEESWVLFTQRAKRMKHHANEISFPGGRIEQGESVETAAIREAEEEIGLDRNDVELWGTLRPLFFGEAGVVTPVVATIGQNVEQRLASLRCADAEVQNIFMASVSDLLARIHYTTFRFSGKSSVDKMPFFFRMPIFRSTKPRLLCNSSLVNCPEKFRIWGLTARTLLEALNAFLPEDAKEREASELLRTRKTDNSC
ncbi:hypothetical protein niasHT_027968 [Heterodera trifolii]|uniref:Nudix hydrolase domain-containing protein n=1 Tax=Heterodera trifolii TaxID=157864 RepID=A0ABD2KE41_9BILA